MQKDKEAQKKFYDEHFGREGAQSGSAFSESTAYFTNRFLESVLKPDFGKILEIGCGDGMLTSFLLKRKSEITAIDISEKAIEKMRGRFSGEIDQGKLKLECSDAVEYLKFADERYDAIIGSGIIHHIEKKDWENLFRLANKRLNPGGIFACGPEPNAGGPYRFCWRFAKFFYNLFGMDFDWEVEKGTLDMIPKKLIYSLKKAGFSDPEIAPFQVIPHFHSKILANIDKKMIKYASGRLSLYVAIKAKKM